MTIILNVVKCQPQLVKLIYLLEQNIAKYPIVAEMLCLFCQQKDASWCGQYAFGNGKTRVNAK
jgi:hypothetical protein